MAKLAEAIKEKGKKGDWWSTKDVIGVTLTVTEDMGAEYDIRMSETYYCVQVTDGKEVKDLHLAKGALKAVARAFQGKENWKGGKFVIGSVTGTGYKTETHVSLLQGDYHPENQQRLSGETNGVVIKKPCKACNGTLGLKLAADGVYVCLNCGTNHTAAEIMQTLSPAPGASPNNIPADSRAVAVAAVLEALKGYPGGVHESRIEEFVKDTLIEKGIVESQAAVWAMLKYGGRIKNDNGCWKVVT